MADQLGAEHSSTAANSSIAVQLDAVASRRLNHAARLTRRSPRSFAQWATALAARHVVLEDALQRYRRGERSLSELADETGFAVEELMDAVAADGRIPADASNDEMMLRKSIEALLSFPRRRS